MRTFEVLCVNPGAVNKWVIMIEAPNADVAMKTAQERYYGVYALIAKEIVS